MSIIIQDPYCSIEIGNNIRATAHGGFKYSKARLALHTLTATQARALSWAPARLLL